MCCAALPYPLLHHVKIWNTLHPATQELNSFSMPERDRHQDSWPSVGTFKDVASAIYIALCAVCGFGAPHVAQSQSSDVHPDSESRSVFGVLQCRAAPSRFYMINVEETHGLHHTVVEYATERAAISRCMLQCLLVRLVAECVARLRPGRCPDTNASRDTRTPTDITQLCRIVLVSIKFATVFKFCRYSGIVQIVSLRIYNFAAFAAFMYIVNSNDAGQIHKDGQVSTSRKVVDMQRLGRNCDRLLRSSCVGTWRYLVSTWGVHVLRCTSRS